MISAPIGSGFVNVFLNTVPTSSPTLSFPSLHSQLKPEPNGEPVRHVEPERLLAGHKSHDASPGQAGFALQGFVIRLPGFHGIPDGPQ
jgi:hypothetical protein